MTGQAKLNHEHYSIKCMGAQLHHYKSHYHSVYYLAFCTTKYLVCIMCRRLIILHLLICFFYLIQFNTISLTSPKIMLALLFTTCFLEKQTFIFSLRKTSPAKTEQRFLFEYTDLFQYEWQHKINIWEGLPCPLPFCSAILKHSYCS